MPNSQTRTHARVPRKQKRRSGIEPLTEALPKEVQKLTAAVKDENLFAPMERRWIEAVKEHRAKGDSRPLSDILGPNVRQYKSGVKTRTKGCIASLAYVLPVLDEFGEEALREIFLRGILGEVIAWSVERQGEWNARVFAMQIEKGMRAWIATQHPEYAGSVEVRVRVEIGLRPEAIDRKILEALGLSVKSAAPSP